MPAKLKSLLFCLLMKNTKSYVWQCPFCGDL